MNNYTKITAHSGACGYTQNSADYLDFAVSSPYDAFEVDIRRVDGRLLLTHDDDADALPLPELFCRMAGSRVAGSRVAGSRIIRADKPPDGVEPIKVNCDCKSAGVTSEIIAVADEYGVSRSRLIFTGSVGKSELRSVTGGGSTVFYNFELFADGGWDALFAMSPASLGEIFTCAADFCASEGVGLNANYRIMTPDAFDALVSRGVPVTLWTVNDETAMREFLSRGVAYITTNKPDAAFIMRHEMNKYTL